MRPSNVHAAWWATVLVFLVHGLLVATWVSRIPAIKTALRLNDAVLGLTSTEQCHWGGLCDSIRGPVCKPLRQQESDCASAALLFCFSLVLPGLAVNAVSLAAALFAFGATAAAMDVSMNAQGVEVEKRLGKPTMSRFHGMFSLGGMVGAGVGGIVAARSIRPVIHFGVSALIYLLVIVVVAPLLLETHDGVQPDERRVSLKTIPRALAGTQRDRLLHSAFGRRDGRLDRRLPAPSAECRSGHCGGRLFRVLRRDGNIPLFGRSDHRLASARLARYAPAAW